MVFSKWAVSKGFTSDKSRQLIDHICRAMVGRDADQVGAHYMLDYIKSGKGIVSLSTEDQYGAQYLKVKPGKSRTQAPLFGMYIADADPCRNFCYRPCPC